MPVVQPASMSGVRMLRWGKNRLSHERVESMSRLSSYRIGLAAAGAILLAPSLGFADDMGMGAGEARQGWYSSLGAGLNILRDSDIKGGGFETGGRFNDGYVING